MFYIKKILLSTKAFLKWLLPNWVFEKLYHGIFWPLLGVILYRNPSKKIKIIGVTGTNGKTTVVHLTTHILEGAGLRVASLSSLRFKINKKEWKNMLKMTMPGRLKMQKFLRQAVNARCEYVVMEVTSEGIKQNRHKHIDFNTAVFTNLTPEHIESHGGFDNYTETKGKFFALPHETSVVNADDEAAEYFLNFEANKKIAYSLKQEYENDNYQTIVPSDTSYDANGLSLKIDGVLFSTSLLSEFNAYNTLAAVCVALSCNLELQDITKYTKTFPGVSGRLERVIGEPFNVFVDYAHTPDAFEKVYKTVKVFSAGRLIGVFGAAGGGRDKWKRPEFAKIVEEYCDEVIITDEDPYSENPQDILKDIEKGFSGKLKYEKILDRRKAINKALQIAKDGDSVLITGKGAEPLMMTKNGPIDWDDRKIVREEFAKIYF